MGNLQKSWKGAPTTNVIQTNLNLYDKDNGCTVTQLVETFDGNPIYRVVFPAGTLPRIRTTFAYTTGQQYTGSIYYKVITQGSHIPQLIFRENGFGTTYASVALNSTSWQRTNITHTFSGSGTSMFLLYQSNSAATTPTIIDFSMPQTELQPFATPFVNGTRSNTQAILDLVGNNTITANSLTYNVDGSFSFNGSSNDVSISGTASNFFTNFSTQQISLDVWINIPSSATWTNGFYGNILSRGSYAGSCGLWRRTTNNQISAYFRQSGATFAAVESVATIQRDTWTNLVATWTGSTLTLYVNGVLESANSGALGTPTVANWTIGDVTAASGNVGNRFQGINSIVKIYNKALSAAEVQQNFNALRGRYGL
jgi:hypothetical protein